MIRVRREKASFYHKVHITRIFDRRKPYFITLCGRMCRTEDYIRSQYRLNTCEHCKRVAEKFR